MKYALLFPLALALCSCHVANRVYNPATAAPPANLKEQSIVAVERTEIASKKYRTDRVDPECDPDQRMRPPVACMAFIEFDEQGEYWDRTQVDKAINLIKKAKTANDHTIVVTFIHGWKNNADDEPGRQNHNVAGFEGVLKYLRDMPDPQDPRRKEYQDFPIVGVYLSWRGDLVPEAWPMRRQLSFGNREAEATRIPGASMTAALTKIMIETHRPPKGTNTSTGHVIMVGHSFGGLVLERALSQAMTDYILRNFDRLAACSTGEDCPTVTDCPEVLDVRPAAAGLKTADCAPGAWADLVVFVNSAAAASEGKQMLDFLQQRQLSFQSKYQTDLLGRTKERPLLVSISSLGDAATRFALPAGHGLSFLNRKVKGSWRDYGNQVDSRPTPKPGEPPLPKLAVELPTGQSAYYLSATAHMEALQSHLIVNVDDKNDLARCGKTSNGISQDPVMFGNVFPVVQGTNTNKQAPPLRYQICEKPGRWNDTLYWAMQMPATVVPDHGHIFNLNFVTLLNNFFPDKDEVGKPGMRPAIAAKPKSATTERK